MSDLFRLIDDVSHGKKNIWEKEPAARKAYEPYVVNRHFSLFQTSLFESQEMNLMPHLPANMQYSYYLHSLESMPRMKKWPKPEAQDALQAVASFFEVSLNKARQIFQILSDEELRQIQEKCTERDKHNNDPGYIPRLRN